MIIKKEILKFYPIIDAQFVKGEKAFKLTKALIFGGAKIIQYRNKIDNDEIFEKEANGIMQTIKKFSQNEIKFIVNDRIEIAKKIEADGVHLGKEDLKLLSILQVRKYFGKNKIIGITARNLEEAKWAEKEKADYVGLSAVYATNTKKDAPAMGLEGLKKIIEKIKIPTVAIGGINEKNFKEILETGVSGVALVSAVCLAKNPEEVVRRFLS